jgi:hypothetical protein
LQLHRVTTFHTQGSAGDCTHPKQSRQGITLNFPLGALAHLGLARAYALSADTTKAKTASNDFFTHWKDADPYISILVGAKAEYAKLQ